MRLARGDIGSHAVLLYGVPGSGKHVLAQALAEAWLCKNPTGDGACGECKACLSFGRGNSADFLLVAPTGPSRLISVDQIREAKVPKSNPPPIPITHFLRSMPLQATNKVVVIEDAHRMNASSANALLKTLEEPHERAKLILTTESIGTMPPTILSRCLVVACELPNRDEVVALAPGASAAVIRMSDGAPGKVATAAEKPEVYERLAAFAGGLIGRHPGSALVAADEFRSISEAIADQGDQSARASNTLALELLAVYLARDPEAPAVWAQDVVEAHRRIQQNGYAPVVLDALFSKMLLEPR